MQNSLEYNILSIYTCILQTNKKTAFYTFALLNRLLYNPEIAKGDF
jgi:hypothetical protein